MRSLDFVLRCGQIAPEALQSHLQIQTELLDLAGDMDSALSLVPQGQLVEYELGFRGDNFAKAPFPQCKFHRCLDRDGVYPWEREFKKRERERVSEF